jgi:hypothetical protein
MFAGPAAICSRVTTPKLYATSSGPKHSAHEYAAPNSYSVAHSRHRKAVAGPKESEEIPGVCVMGENYGERDFLPRKKGDFPHSGQLGTKSASIDREYRMRKQ